MVWRCCCWWCAVILTLLGAFLLLHQSEALAADVAGSGAGTLAARSSAPSFRQDIDPLFTRYGCNAGSCHGKLAGQNGFRLSLRGYAPEWDHEWITKELNGRRVDYARPENSLILLKATGQVGHEGGRRFDKDSRAAKVITEWIRARTPGPDPAESDAVKLDVETGGVLKIGQTRQLVVKATWPDGHVRDVTWMVQFFSNDDSTVSVTPEGVVKALRHGAAAVRAHFQGLVSVVTFQMPYDAAVDAKQYSQTNNFIDEHVLARLAELRIPVSGACDDATFVRRAFLDTIGTLPSLDEVTAFVSDSHPDKRARLIDHLLARPEWADYWAMNLCDQLQNRKERDHDVRGAKNVRAFYSWVRQQLVMNRPWDQIARDVVLATGDSSTHPEIGYYIYNVGEKQHAEESEIGESLAMAFLGTRIGCAKCHNHPLEKFTQDDYYRFSAFFSRISMKRMDPEKGVTTLTVASSEEREQRKQIEQAEKQLVEAKKAAEGKTGEEAKKAAKKIAEATQRVSDQNKRLVEVMAKPPTAFQPRTKKQMAAMPLDRSVPKFEPGHDPREALVKWMIDPSNEAFSGNMVNRLWKHFMGVGLVEQVDDLRSSNPPSNPELWKALNHDFVAHGFDLKSMMRLILNSRVYQLSSTTLTANEQDHRFYSHYYARRLPAEVLSDAISFATGEPDHFPGYPTGIRAVQLPEPGVNSYFLTIFGRSERVTACACERSSDVTLPQLLYLNNGEEVRNKLRADDGKLMMLLKKKLNETTTIDDVFLMTLCRRPTTAEVKAVTDAMSAGDGREDVYRDLYWALLNSKEFAFNH
jgi:hypothetical protein